MWPTSPTSQWSRDVSRGQPRTSIFTRAERAEAIYRALVTRSAPDGTPILSRPLTSCERRALAARAHELKVKLAPQQRALARISAVLAAGAADPVRARADAAFASVRPTPTAHSPE
jgi:hypothetical protein